LAIAVIADGDQEILLDYGDDKFDEDTFFQIGSITKTMTGLLVADAVTRKETSLDATVGSVLGDDAGNCATVTLLNLITQHSGLPRLPPNLHLEQVDPKDPYASYTEADIIEALRMVEPPSPKYAYSNFGFMLLGLLLGRITGITYAELVRERVFSQMGMNMALCGSPPEQERIPGYEESSQTPWWTTQLPGAGGIACGIKELAQYVRSHLSPPDSLRSAVEMTLAEHAPGPPVMGLGWLHQGGGHWHNGGTGGFHSFAALHRGTNTGIALLANSHDAESVDKVGFGVLTELVRSRAAT
jgi:CubicO group peptidase (beta-lactamase class C family)